MHWLVRVLDGLAPEREAYRAVRVQEARIALLEAELRYQRRNLADLSRALWSAGHHDLSAYGTDRLVERIDALLGRER